MDGELTAACGDVESSAPATPATTGQASGRAACHGCGRPIKDRWLLSAVGRSWHENCLRCSYCQCALAAVGSTLFARADLLLCRRDYLRLELSLPSRRHHTRATDHPIDSPPA